MKRRNKILTLLLAVAPFISAAQTEAGSKLKQMDWLLGTWTRTNAAPGKSGYEIWHQTSSMEWSGKGIAMKGADTTFVEKLKIAAKDGKLYYIADVPQNKQPVYFEITDVTDNSFVCENPNHDFPKKIAYRFNGQEIHARVSSGDKGIDYVFVRSK